jgi:hypothetical protein
LAKDVWLTLERSDPEYLPPHWYLSRLARYQRNMPLYLAELRSIAQLTHAQVDVDELAACEEGYRQDGANGLMEADAEFQILTVQERSAGYLTAAEVLDLAHRKDEALNYIELAYKHRDPAFPILSNPSTFSDLAGIPQFEELKLRSRLPFPEGRFDALSSSASRRTGYALISEK